jgi:hypothetical protein
VSDEASLHWHGWCDSCGIEQRTYTHRATGIPRCPVCGSDLESFTVHSGVPAPTEEAAE